MANSHAARHLGRRDFLEIVGGLFLGAMGPGLTVHAAQAPNAKGGPKRFRVVDTHFHTFNSRLQGTNGIPHYYPDSTIEYLLSVMDTGGVDKAFLITYNAEDVAPEMRSGGVNPVLLQPVANHEYQVKAWAAHKDRFWWFTAGVNPLHEDHLKTLDHQFHQGASGVKLIPMFHGLLPDNPAWLPIYELCQKRSKPIIIDWSWWYRGNSVIGYGYNESKERQALCRSYRSFADWLKPMDPIFRKYSTVQISLAHCGTPRVGDIDHEDLFAFMVRHPNCHCDLANASPVENARDARGARREDYEPQFIGQLVKAVGPRKIMYGTDMPYWGKGLERYRLGPRRWTVIADDCSFLTDEEKQLILAGNAERFVRNEA